MTSIIRDSDRRDPSPTPAANSREAGRAGTKPQVTVVLPAYNEAGIIGESLARLCEYMDGIADDYDWEIVVVNDGSSDQTGPIAEEFALSNPNVRVLHHRTNFNLGQALQYAFNNCHGDYVVTLDSDLSYAPEHIGELLTAIRETGAKVVLASPYAHGGRTTGIPRARLFWSRSANQFLSMTTKRQLATLTSMARAYDRQFLSNLNLKSTDVGINTEIIYKAQMLNAKICEIPAHLDWSSQLSAGGERSSSIKFTKSVLAYLSSGFMFRPLAFFALPGLALFLLSLYTLSWSAYRVAGHLIAGEATAFSTAVSLAFQDAPHTFIVGGIALMLAVQLMSLGILAAQSKAYFEEAFHLGSSIYRQTRSAASNGS